MKQLMILLFVLSWTSASWSQDVDESAEPESEVAGNSETSTDEEDEELDEPGYGLEEEEDDFIPSQEVSADQSLPFPVDI